MTWYPIQQSFVWGEIDPGYGAQVDTQIYQQGLKRCRNMWPTPHGNVQRRVGMAFVAEIDADAAGDARVFPIEAGIDSRVLAIFSNGLIHIYTADSLPRQGQLVKNFQFKDGLSHWDRYGPSGNDMYTIHDEQYGTATDTNWLWMYIDGQPGGTRGGVRQTIDILTHSNPITLTYHLYAREFSAPVTYRQDVLVKISFGTDSLDGVYDERHNLDPGEELIVTTTLPALDAYSGPVTIEIEMADAYDGQINQILVNNVGVLYDEPPFDTAINAPSPYADDELHALQMVQNPFNNAAFFVHPDYPPYELIYADIQVTFDPVVFPDPGGNFEVPHWVETPSPTTGYPRAVGAYQGRVFFGGTYAEPQSVWSSEPGDWYNLAFDDSATITDSTPVWYTMTAIGQIQWIQGFKALLHGTSNGEHLIASQGTVVSAGDLQVVEHSRYGSAHVQAEMVGDECFYLSGDKRKVRYINYQRDTGGYHSVDLTHSSGHITQEQVRRLAFSKDPAQVLWCPLEGGASAAMSYDPGLKIIGWHYHSTLGQILDATEGRFNGVDYIYFVIRRYIDGQQKLYLEALKSDDTIGQVYMDCYTWRIYETPTDTITGLEYLESMNVTAMSDSRTKIGEFVVAGGQITLPAPVSACIVGLPFESEAETLPARPAPPSQERGTSHGSKKGWGRVGLRLHDSAMPVVNGEQWRLPDGAPGPMFTGDVNQHLTGWSEQAPISIKTSEPLPLNIIGIFGKLADEDF